MSDANKEKGFALPGSAVARQYKQLLILTPVPVAIGAYVSNASWSIILISAVSIVALLGFGYWLVTHNKIIHLSPQGMRGQNSFGLEIKLDWEQPVVIGRDVYANMPAFSVSDGKLKKVIFPHVIALLPEFQELLARFAPPDHALVAAVEKLKAEPRPHD